MRQYHKKASGIGLLFLLSAMLMLHLLVIIGIVPYQIFWGSQIENDAANLSSEQIIEKTVLAPATFLMSLLSLRLAISKKT